MAERERELYQVRRAAEAQRLEEYQRSRERDADAKRARQKRAAEQQAALRRTIEAARTFGLGAARGAGRPIRHLTQDMRSASADAGGAGLAPPARSAQAPDARGGSSGGSSGSGHGPSGAGEAPSFFGVCASVGGLIGAAVVGQGKRRLRAELLAAAAAMGATSRPTCRGKQGSRGGGGGQGARGGAQRDSGSFSETRSGGGSDGGGGRGGRRERGRPSSTSATPGGMSSALGRSGVEQQEPAGRAFAIGDLVGFHEENSGEAEVEVSYLNEDTREVMYTVRPAHGAGTGAAAVSRSTYTSSEMTLLRPTDLDVYRVGDVVSIPSKKRTITATVTRAALRNGSAEYHFRCTRVGSDSVRNLSLTAAEARDRGIKLASSTGYRAGPSEHKGYSEDEDGDGGSAHGSIHGRSAGGGGDGRNARSPGQGRSESSACADDTDSEANVGGDRVRVRVRVRVSTGGKSQGMPRKRQQSPQRVMREGY